jgi:hypothetical protein
VLRRRSAAANDARVISSGTTTVTKSEGSLGIERTYRTMASTG